MGETGEDSVSKLEGHEIQQVHAILIITRFQINYE
jgi:hypothetical protein